MYPFIYVSTYIFICLSTRLFTSIIRLISLTYKNSLHLSFHIFRLGLWVLYFAFLCNFPPEMAAGQKRIRSNVPEYNLM